MKPWTFLFEPTPGADKTQCTKIEAVKEGLNGTDMVRKRKAEEAKKT